MHTEDFKQAVEERKKNIANPIFWKLQAKRWVFECEQLIRVLF